MSWRYKLYDIEPEQVVAIGPINENFQPFVEELSGGLNEHNFAADAFTRDNFATDMALRLHRSIPAVIIQNPLTGYDNPTLADWVDIQAQDGWQSFTESGLRLEFVGRGGTTYICASFNIHCGTNRTWEYPDDLPDPLASPNGGRVPKFRQMGFGYLVALRVNGAVLHETILGSGDPSQDDFRAYKMTQQASAPERNYKDPIGALPQGGGGLAGARLPIVVDAVVELLPGTNLIEVAVMNIRGSMQTYKNRRTHIGHRELFALEMVR